MSSVLIVSEWWARCWIQEYRSTEWLLGMLVSFPRAMLVWRTPSDEIVARPRVNSRCHPEAFLDEHRGYPHVSTSNMSGMVRVGCTFWMSDAVSIEICCNWIFSLALRSWRAVCRDCFYPKLLRTATLAMMSTHTSSIPINLWPTASYDQVQMPQ
jgi:hypothetical protein